jgi:hypothetical protein
VQSTIPCIFSQHHKTSHNKTNDQERFTEHPFSIPHIKPYMWHLWTAINRFITIPHKRIQNSLCHKTLKFYRTIIIIITTDTNQPSSIPNIRERKRNTAGKNFQAFWICRSSLSPQTLEKNRYSNTNNNNNNNKSKEALYTDGQKKKKQSKAEPQTRDTKRRRRRRRRLPKQKLTIRG